jgi:hypothetical protein
MPEQSAELFLTEVLFQLVGWGLDMATKPGLYANIHAKQARIAAGSGEKMRKPGTPGAPTAKAFKESAKTAKPANKGK